MYGVITNPPRDLPTGHEIRQQRPHAGVTFTALVNALDIDPTRISTFERGLTFSNDLAYRA